MIFTKKLIILLVFADHKGSLDLQRERDGVKERLRYLEKKGLIEVMVIDDATVDKIFQAFNDYGDRICIFQYSGHSSEQQLELEQGAGHAQGVAELLGQQKALRLVVINGCASYSHVARLKQEKVSAVIATHSEVEDRLAINFALQLYQSLAEKKNIRQAFVVAKALAHTRKPYLHITQFSAMGGAKLEGTQSVWGLYTENEKAQSWTLPTRRFPLHQVFIITLCLLATSFSFPFIFPQGNHLIHIQAQTPEGKVIPIDPSAKITINLGSAIQMIPVLVDGKALLKIPKKYLNTRQRIQLWGLPGYNSQDAQYLLETHKPLIITVENDQSRAVIKGVVKHNLANEKTIFLQRAKVIFVELDTVVFTNAQGIFELKDIPIEKQRKRYRVLIQKTGYRDYSLYVKPNNQEVYDYPLQKI